jgi:hypothetical protein
LPEFRKCVQKSSDKMSKIAFANKICTAIFLFYLFVLPTMVGMTMIFYWSCLALLDLWSALLTLCVALLLVESRYPDHFFARIPEMCPKII